MADASADPCWCVALPAAVPLPGAGQAAATCWCPVCLKHHIAELALRRTPAADKANKADAADD
jgi:hypothetical protein